jgi:RimJ/RimL family protein N-acetyltransferase
VQAPPPRPSPPPPPLPGPVDPLEPFELRIDELLLRPWRLADAEDFWTALQDPEIALWNGSGSASRDDAVAVLARRANWSTGDHASWAIVDADDRLLGSLSLHRIDLLERDAEIGYWTVPAARGRGVAPRTVAAVCGWAFDVLGLERIELVHAAENVASGRVAEKAGFTREGRLRRSHRYGDGERHDELLWARLAEDPPPSS